MRGASQFAIVVFGANNSGSNDGLRDACLGLKLPVNGTRHQLHSLWEEVIEQAHEDACVICCQLAQVEVPQSSQQHLNSNHA